MRSSIPFHISSVKIRLIKALVNFEFRRTITSTYYRRSKEIFNLGSIVSLNHTDTFSHLPLLVT